MNYPETVTEYSGRQYRTGSNQKLGGHLDDVSYAVALDNLVIACVDIALLHGDRMLIGKRTWEPQPDWWMIGGRMRKGELYQEAAVRNCKRELGLELLGDRFVCLGTYNLIWDTRAQTPQENGCHMISVTMRIELKDEEAALLRFNEEYSDHRWVDPKELVDHANQYHPCLVQVASDLLAHR